MSFTDLVWVEHETPMGKQFIARVGERSLAVDRFRSSGSWGYRIFVSGGRYPLKTLALAEASHWDSEIAKQAAWAMHLELVGFVP